MSTTHASPPIGAHRWVIPEGYIPRESHGPAPELESHEACCILNAGDRYAHVEITIFYTDRDPAGPYRHTVPPRRAVHLRYNDFDDPEPIPRATPYASIVESSEPVVVQYTRLDSRQAENALMTSLAHPC